MHHPLANCLQVSTSPVLGPALSASPISCGPSSCISFTPTISSSSSSSTTYWLCRSFCAGPLLPLLPSPAAASRSHDPRQGLLHMGPHFHLLSHLRRALFLLLLRGPSSPTMLPSWPVSSSPPADCVRFGSLVACAGVLARAHHQQQPGVAAAALKAVAAGGGDRDRAIIGEQQAVRALFPEHVLRAPAVHRRHGA